MDNPDWPIKKRGDEDQVVRTLQHLLNSHGASVTPDGVFGEQTEAAVISFQKAGGLAVDGVVGSTTWEA